jgi:hypothetical protein
MDIRVSFLPSKKAYVIIFMSIQMRYMIPYKTNDLPFSVWILRWRKHRARVVSFISMIRFLVAIYYSTWAHHWPTESSNLCHFCLQPPHTMIMNWNIVRAGNTHQSCSIEKMHTTPFIFYNNSHISLFPWMLENIAHYSIYNFVIERFH